MSYEITSQIEPLIIWSLAPARFIYKSVSHMSHTPAFITFATKDTPHSWSPYNLVGSVNPSCL